MRVGKVVKNTARLLLAVTIGLSLVGLLPATARAETNPVDLELGGEGATSWNIINIQPVDSGTKTVELHNAGSKDGFVTIWVSDIISTEGMNPESETGNTAEPGEIDDYLLLGLTAAGLSTSLNLPKTVNNLPHNALGPDYIEIIPLKAGDTIDLQWEWELPAQTGNDAQGDGISFTINYLLREFSLTDVSDVVNDEGVFTAEVTAESEGGKAELVIEEGVIALTEEGEPLSELWIIETDKEPPAPPADAKIVGLTVELGPDGATFDPPITLTSTYDPGEIPDWVSEEDLVIATWDENAGEWVELEGGTVDTVNNTISAPVSHFSRYTIIAHVPLPPSPVPPFPGGFFVGEEGLSPPTQAEEEPPPPTGDEEGEEERITVKAILEIDILGSGGSVEIEADGTLSESLTLTEPDGNFVIEVKSGSKITGSDGILLTRIELTVVEESVVVPDDMVILSPLYKLTGYTNGLESSRINFDPPAQLAISYTPGDLPGNIFLPFVAYYTVDQGLVPIEPPPGATVEVGKAKAQISYASLFVVAARLVPPPPPLPAKFQISNLIVNPRQGKMGQSVVISLEIANDGETTGSYELQLKLDGIVRIVKEITLAAKSSKIVSFEIHNLSVGKHQVKVAGLSGQFRIVSTAILPAESTIDWLTLDLSIGAAVVIGLATLYLVRRRL